MFDPLFEQCWFSWVVEELRQTHILKIEKTLSKHYLCNDRVSGYSWDWDVKNNIIYRRFPTAAETIDYKKYIPISYFKKDYG